MSAHTPAVVARQIQGRSEIAIRAARPGDAQAIRRLALLADRAVPAEPILVAESDGAVVVALSTTTDAVVSDPFRATADLVQLLRLRSTQLHDVAA